MEKKCFIFGFLVAIFLFQIAEDNRLSAQNGFANYITLSNGQFWDGDTQFHPLCVNYLVVYPYDKSDYYNPIYYVSPHLCYSNIKRIHYDTWIYRSPIQPQDHWGYGDDGATERDSAGIKLANDLRRIDSLGFNVVRLNPSMYWNGDTLKVPTGSYSEYFRLTDSLIAKCARNHLRVIMVLSDKPNTYNQFEQYCVYLDSVTRHYSTNKTVMAYVVYMEPLWKWENAHVNDKIMISNWARKWYYLIKKNAPNQLVTYGLDGLGNIMIWDPSALTYDFLSMHFYYDFSDLTASKNGVHTEFRWMYDNIGDAWVIGETGFSGANVDSCRGTSPVIGSEADQREYARFTTWLAVGCGCKGYAWWQYQDINWKSCDQNHHGLITTYPGQRFKQVANIFPISPINYPEPYSCIKPTCYYDVPGYNYGNISGMVIDENSNPIQDAIVKAYTSGYHTQYSTFSNNQGQFTVFAPEDSLIHHLWISYKGFSCKKLDFSTPPTDPIVLTHLNYNHWKKNWTNINYPKAGDTVLINSTDRVIVGNFYGDEAQEMLVLKALIPSSSQAELYRFHTDHWEKIWAGPLGNWNIGFNDKFFAGDYNGDGYDELLCVQNNPNGWASIFHYGTLNWKNPWVCIWTNQGNGQIGEWNYATGDILLPGRFNDSTYCSLICIRNQGRMKNALCQRLQSSSWTAVWLAASLNENTYIGSWPISEIDKYYVGDFSGDGIDELFCVQSTNGTSDMMTLMQYNAFWTTLWSNNGISEGLGIYPYRANLHVGNYDTDQADEFLGVGSWATKFDFNTSNQWDWSWSTYESGKLSDWSVNPTHRIFFLKTMTDVPDYLFVVRGIPRINYNFDAYSFDP